MQMSRRCSDATAHHRGSDWRRCDISSKVGGFAWAPESWKTFSWTHQRAAQPIDSETKIDWKWKWNNDNNNNNNNNNQKKQQQQ